MEARTPLDANRPQGFASTHWSVIQACAGSDEAAYRARAEFCRDYWYPIYAYIRRLGQQGCDAEDLTQDFFAEMLRRPWFDHADRSRGKFRSFLLASLNNFLRDHFDRSQARRRGGSYQHIPLDLRRAESCYTQTQATGGGPAEHYELSWASAIVATTLQRLEREYVGGGKEMLFRDLKVFLKTEGALSAYETIATSTGLTISNVKVCVHRLRQRYGEILRDEVAKTVTAPEDIEDEVRHLRAVFAASR